MKPQNLFLPLASFILLCCFPQLLFSQYKVFKLIESGKYEKAKEYCAKQKGTKRTECFDIMGNYYFKLDSCAKSGECFELSDNKKYLEYVADKYLRMKDYEHATYYYEKAFSEDSEKLTESYLDIAYAANREKDYEHSVIYYEKAYADDEDKLKEKYLEAGKNYCDLEEYEKAGELYDKIGYKQGFEFIGDVCFKKGDLDKAKLYYAKSAELYKASQDQEMNKSLYYYSLWTDNRTGQVYKTVTIGEQEWMVENLNVSTYNDGTPVRLAVNDDEWMIRTGACCWYQYDSSRYDNPYGRLYNWYAVNTGKLCPAEWHVPSTKEWKSLEMFLEANHPIDKDALVIVFNPGGLLKEAGTKHWDKPNEGATNASGFTALPGGIAISNIKLGLLMATGGSDHIEERAFFYSSSEAEDNEAYGYHQAWSFVLSYKSGRCEYSKSHRGNGCSVRCIKD